MTRYFRLFEECYLVKGANGGAIYNLLSGEVFSLNCEEQEIVALFELNTPLSEVSLKTGATQEKLYHLLRELIQKKLGSFYSRPIYIEKISKEAQWKENLFFGLPPVIRRCFLEITTKCDYLCQFCGSKDFVRRTPCLGCNKWINKGSECSLDDMLSVLQIMRNLGCNYLILTGGDVFLDWEKTRIILRDSKNLGYNEVLLIIGGKIPSFAFEELERLKIAVLVQKHVTPDNKNQIVKELLKIKDTLERFGFILVGECTEIEFLTEVLTELKNSLQPPFAFIDLAIPVKKEVTNKFSAIINAIPRTSFDEFSWKKKYHPCIGGTISVTADGRILPCPGLRDFEVAHISSLLSNTNEVLLKLEAFWKLTKDKIYGCSLCQFRYVCNDCRYVEYKLGGDLRGMYSCKLARQNLLSLKNLSLREVEGNE